ncbi:MAG: fluoride efflux transporter CrcB [Saprospiraceae bacterium]
MNFILVFIGGGLGSICRFGISVWLKNHGYIFPMATFLANALSCIVLGALFGWTMKNGNASDIQKYLLMTGFCGGFSTFSTFTHETFQLLQSGNLMHAFGNILLSLIVCLVCIFIGMKIAG